jgi:hypothetical protein
MIRYTLPLQRINILFGVFFIISSSLFSQVTVDSINELRGVNPGTNQTVQVRGYYEPGDWGDWFNKRSGLSSLRITEKHNGLRFFGVLNLKYLDNYQGSGRKLWEYSAPNDKFPVVDEQNSVILKKIPRSEDNLNNESMDFRIIQINNDDGGSISNIHFHDFAIDGSSEMHLGLQNILVYAANIKSLFFENIASHSGRHGILVYGSNVSIKNFLAYLNWWQGVGQSETTGIISENNTYEGIRVWGKRI